MIMQGTGVKLGVLIAVALMVAGVNPAYAAKNPPPPPVNLQPIVNLSNNSGASVIPVIESVGSHVYVAWQDSTNGRPQIYFRQSADNGTTWSGTTVFTGALDAAAVQIAAWGPNVYLTWKQDQQTAFASSNNYGVSFNPTVIFSEPQGTITEPSLATNGTAVYVAWQYHGTNNGSKQVMFTVSYNYGVSFAAPKCLGSTNRFGMLSCYSATEIEIAAQGDHVYVVWDSIYVVASANGGKTWGSRVQVSPTGCGSAHTCLGREPMIAASGSYVYVTFPSNYGGSYQAWLAVSSNYGATWSTKQVTSGFTSAREIQVGTCASSNDQVPCGPTPDVYITFRGQAPNGGHVNQYITTSYNNGATFTAPVDVSNQKKSELGFGGVAVNGSDVFLVWPHTDKKTGIVQMYVAASNDSAATWLGNMTGNQVVQVSNSTVGVVGMGDSNTMHDQGPVSSASAGHIFIVWEDDSTGDGDVYFSAGTIAP
jgi:BNR repeat-like domain